MSWCLENSVALINLSFLDHSPDFRNSDSTCSAFVRPRSRLMNFFLNRKTLVKLTDRLSLSDRYLRLLRAWVKVLDKADDQTLGENELDGLLAGSVRGKIILIRAWDIQCPNALENHQDKIRAILTPKPSTWRAIDEIKRKLPENNFVVGIHIRRGDYSNWLDGKYFFSWESYEKWIEQTKKALSNKGRNPVFIICSDERPPKSFFSSSSIFFTDSNALVDLYALSICNLLLGPPSSFGEWAAFYGKCKRICLNESIDLSDNRFLQAS
jgi:hypothetical protein